MGWYDPKAGTNVLPEGEYEATIESVENKPSSSGKPMQRVTFRVYGTTERTIREYFVQPDSVWKYRKLAQALNQVGAFDAGTFDAANHIGANLRVKLGIKTTAEYGDQNTVEAFMPTAVRGSEPTTRAKPPAGKASAVIDSDDIPF